MTTITAVGSTEKLPHAMSDEALDKSGLGQDDRDIVEMGYQVEVKERNFTVLNIFAIGFTICNTACAVIVSLYTTIASGGPITLIWAQVFIYVVSLCVAVSLGELASAYPNAGGQYYFAGQLAPDSIRSTVSFIVGIVSWAASVFTTASVTLVAPQMIIGMMILKNPDMESKPWMVFVGYQVTNIFMFGFNAFSRILPAISRLTLGFSLCTILIIFIACLASAPSYQPASFVFTEFVNDSGWSAKGITLLTGMVGVNWGFSCLDAVTHLAEEIPDPRRNVPKALIGTVVVGIVTSFPFTLMILFCLQDIDKIITTPTLVPSIELFNQVFSGNTKAAIGLQTLILITDLGSTWGVHTWQSRLAWSFARDHGLPFSKHLGHIAGSPYDVPLWAHAFSCFWVAILGCLYLGSTVAFNSFVGGAIIMQYITYSICIVLLLMKGRKHFRHGPFWLKTLGPIANYVTLAWTVVTTIFYCFPPFMPVTPGTMNYVSVVIVGIFGMVAIWYGLVGRRFYTPPLKME